MRRLVSVRGIDARLHLQSCLSAGMRTLCALCLLFTCVLTATAAAKERYPFAVTSARSGTGQTLIARNRGPAPVSVRLMLANAENVSSGQPLPVYAVVRPYSEMLLLQVRRSDPRRSQRFATESTYQLGSFLAVPDARAVYRLPYENGRGFVISQAADGPLTTHHGEDSRYAVDFRMPENTPIVAARAGVVIATESAHRLGGKDRALLSLANHVRILHVDDTIATYAHLAFGGVRVRLGERVTSGTLIGYSGATGYTSGPHLHFVVQKLARREAGFAPISVPLRFSAGRPPQVFEPRYQQLAVP